MKKPLCLLLCLVVFTAACATPPLVKEIEGPVIENAEVGFHGYILPLLKGYSVIPLENVRDDPLVQDWIEHRGELFERLHIQPEIADQVLLVNGNRFIWFTVEEVNTPFPFVRLAPDRRERFLRYQIGEFQRRAGRYGANVATSSFQRIGDREVVRTALGGDSVVEHVGMGVMGGLNEIYHFDGLAFEGEGGRLEQDILALIQDLSF